MPLSTIQLLRPDTPNSLTALLQGGGSVLSQALSNAVQLGRDAVDKQSQQERSFLSERRAEINLSQRRGENAQKQINLDRSFNEDVTRDRRNFARSVFSQDRQFNRNVFTQDRSFSEGVRQFNRTDARAEARLGIARSAEERAVKDDSFELSERARMLRQRDQSDILLETHNEGGITKDLSDEDISELAGAAKFSGDKREIEKFENLQKERASQQDQKRDLERIEASRRGVGSATAIDKVENEYVKASEGLSNRYGTDQDYDLGGVEYRKAITAKTFDDFLPKDSGALTRGAPSDAQKASIRADWRKFYNAARAREGIARDVDPDRTPAQDLTKGANPPSKVSDSSEVLKEVRDNVRSITDLIQGGKSRR